MTTIASPRPSISLSSRRTSTETVVKSETSAARPAGQQRRNRAALRSFYGIADGAKADDNDSADTFAADESHSQPEMDRRDLDVDHYVDEVLAREGLQGILKVEVGLLRDIRGLDGEKKALVYDNYSKLIGATDTIRKMRGNMEPLKPAFTTLAPAIADIANSATALSSGGIGHADAARTRTQRQQQQIVRYVLGTPDRLRILLDQGERAKADEEWLKVSRILDKWSGVPGAAQVREQCEQVLSRT